ncbi:MAG TPA: fibronectin type III domain-containing protein [Streptosporangiaceae bacterium]|nr:fibronectin type III domain-containing protein [Streptosporangiaceae bacterium]
MTDPEVAGQDPSTAPAPAPPWTPPTAQDSVTAQEHVTSQEPVFAQYPVTVAPRSRRRWVWVTLAALVVGLGLAVGLVVWAPWIPPPVLRPARLVAGPATANSVSFRWSRPPTGPLPDKYLIFNDGTQTGSVAGTATSYRQAGLSPATSYQYRVVAVRGGKRSPQSALLPLKTVTPPISQARLQGSWTINIKYRQHVFTRRHETDPWVVTPECAAGACDAKVRVGTGRHSYSLKLTLAGDVYRGQALDSFVRCGPKGNFIPDPTTLKFRVHVTTAAPEGQVWGATSLAGTIAGSHQYVSSATFYCPAGTFTATVSGSAS